MSSGPRRCVGGCREIRHDLLSALDGAPRVGGAPGGGALLRRRLWVPAVLLPVAETALLLAVGPAVRRPLARKSPRHRRWTCCTTSAGSPPTTTPGCRSAWSSRRSLPCGACTPPGSSARPGGKAPAPLGRWSGRPGAPWSSTQPPRSCSGPGSPCCSAGRSVTCPTCTSPPCRQPLAVALVLHRGALNRPGAAQPRQPPPGDGADP